MENEAGWSWVGSGRAGLAGRGGAEQGGVKCVLSAIVCVAPSPLTQFDSSEGQTWRSAVSVQQSIISGRVSGVGVR